MDITKEMDKMAESLEKSIGTEVTAYDSLKATVLEIGVEGLRKSIPNLSDEQKTLLKSVLEDIKKSEYDVEPEDQTTINGEMDKNLMKPEFDKDDEEIAEEAKKTHRNQGGVPVEGWEGQMIKACDMEKGEEGSEDEKQDKKIAENAAEKEVKDHEMTMHKKGEKDKMKKSFKALVERMIERKLEKSQCVSILAKNMETSEDKIGAVWDALEKAMTYSYDDSTSGSDLPEKDQVKADNAVEKEMSGKKPEASVDTPAYKDKSAENSNLEDDVSKQKNETADEGQKPPATMKKSEEEQSEPEIEFSLTKAEDPFKVRKHGQNTHFSVDSYNAAEYISNIQKDRFGELKKGMSCSDAMKSMYMPGMSKADCMSKMSKAGHKFPMEEMEKCWDSMSKMKKSVNDLIEAGEDLDGLTYAYGQEELKKSAFTTGSFSDADMDAALEKADMWKEMIQEAQAEEAKKEKKDDKKKKSKGRQRSQAMGIRG